MIKEYSVAVYPVSIYKKCIIQGKTQKCHKKPKFSVFNLDGKPKSSRLDSCCCEKHLPKAIIKAHEDNAFHYEKNKKGTL